MNNSFFIYYEILVCRIQAKLDTKKRFKNKYSFTFKIFLSAFGSFFNHFSTLDKLKNAI